VKTRLVFTAYNRPDYFATVMDTWTRVRGFADWQPTVFLEPGPAQDEMTRIATEAGVAVKLNPLRRGVLTNPWNALHSAFFTDADFAVLAEDDVTVSSDVLEYFHWAADRYAADPGVLAVCAFTRTDHSDPAVVHLNDRFCPLVWGTWHDRWPDLRDSWDHDYSSGLVDGTPSGWDWNINLRVANGRRFVTPGQSRSDHIGQFNGTHMQPQDFPSSQAVAFRPDRAPCDYRPELH
jgi:hypothetical protein